MPSLPPELLAKWLQPGALVAAAVGGLGLLVGAFRNLRADLKDEMRAGETRVNRRVDELKDEMKEMKLELRDEMKEMKLDLRDEMKEMKLELRDEMSGVKEEMKELKTLLIRTLQLVPAAKP